MAKKSDTTKSKAKKPSMRDVASGKKQPKKRRLKVNGTKATTPLKKVYNFGKKEYHPIRLPDNKFGRVLNKRGRIIPKYFREAWQEIRLTTWPGRRETARLTVAVFVFSAVFAIIVAILDFGLDKLFRSLLTS